MSRGPGRWQRALLEATEAAIDPETGWPGWVSVDAASHWGETQHLPPAPRPFDWKDDPNGQWSQAWWEQDSNGTWVARERRQTRYWICCGLVAPSIPRAEQEAIRRAMRTLVGAGRVEGGNGAVRRPLSDDQRHHEAERRRESFERLVRSFKR